MRTLVACLTLSFALLLGACSSRPEPEAPPAPAGPAVTTPAGADGPVAAKPAGHTKATTFSIQDGHLVLPGPVLFETGSDRLKPESEEVLAFVKDYLDDKESITTMRVEGHAYGGPEKENQVLSEKRALAAARWLVGRGVSCQRILPVGFGSTKPAAAGGPPRIDFVNAALRGRAIGGSPLDGGGQTTGSPCS